MQTPDFILSALTRIPRILAHPGHPGPADHGDLTHLFVGLAVAVPLVAGVWIVLRRRNGRAAASRIVHTDKPSQEK